MKKKVLAALLAVSMMGTLLTACGNEEAPAVESQVESSVEEATPEPAPEVTEAPVESVAESTEEASAEVDLTAIAEELPAEAAYHFNFDGTDEGIVPVAQVESDDKPAGATFAIAEAPDAAVQYAAGPVGDCTYIDGSFGLKLPVEALNTETYTISFWMNADRLSNYGPTLQLGSNMGGNDTESVVKWINFTQTEWGANSAKIFPVVWDRNSETGVWPWVYAADDSIHGKKEWVMVTLVATGNIYNFADDGLDRNGCKFYLNGQLAFDASDAAYGGLAPEVLTAEQDFEAYFGVNYWDSMFKGFVDDMYIYTEALTDGQVASLYLQGDPNVESVASAPAEEEAEPVAADHSDVVITGTQVGATDCSTGFWTEFSDIWEVPAGESVTKNIVNYSSTLNNWNNFVVILQNVAAGHSADDDAAYAEYGVVRADNYGWGAGYEGIAVAECDYDWTTFTTDLDRANVEVTVTNNGDTADVVAVVTTADGSKTYTQKYTGIATGGDLYFCFTVDGSFIDIQ